ncbi:MAG: C39 family peptidase, partial [Candidatus Diapherotrites archaeon]
GSSDCGPASAAMLLTYYGITAGPESVRKAITRSKKGTFIGQLGLFLMQKGFEVEIVGLNPAFFTKQSRKFSGNRLIQYLEKVREHQKSAKNKKALLYFVKFLQAGGKMRNEIPTEQMIRKELKEGRPVGALLTSNFLNEKKPKMNYHFNIITGIDRRHIYVNDPAWPPFGGRKKYSTNEYLYAIHVAVRGSLLLVRPKKGRASHA